MSDILTFNTETQQNTIHNSVFKCSGYGLGELIQGMKSGLEIGCDVGDTSEFLLNANKELMLSSVDPYMNYTDWNGRDLHERQHVFESVTKRLENYGNRFNLIRKTSDEAVDNFYDESFDFIFIDGLHTYEQLTKDCANYYSKLRTGGIFAGHDFTAIEGVNRAAKEFASSKNKVILNTECDVWYWYK